MNFDKKILFCTIVTTILIAVVGALTFTSDFGISTFAIGDSNTLLNNTEQIKSDKEMLNNWNKEEKEDSDEEKTEADTENKEDGSESKSESEVESIEVDENKKEEVADAEVEKAATFKAVDEIKNAVKLTSNKDKINITDATAILSAEGLDKFAVNITKASYINYDGKNTVETNKYKLVLTDNSNLLDDKVYRMMDGDTTVLFAQKLINEKNVLSLYYRLSEKEEMNDALKEMGKILNSVMLINDETKIEESVTLNDKKINAKVSASANNAIKLTVGEKTVYLSSYDLDIEGSGLDKKETVGDYTILYGSYKDKESGLMPFVIQTKKANSYIKVVSDSLNTVKNLLK